MLPRQQLEQHMCGGVVETVEGIAAHQIGPRSAPVELQSVSIPNPPESDALENDTYFPPFEVPAIVQGGVNKWKTAEKLQLRIEPLR